VIRVSDYIANYLEKIGIEAVFLLSGGGMMHLLDSISRQTQLKYYCNHHEQCSGMAADAYARISGKTGVCYATSGPGGTNTLTAVVGAYQDSSPVLFITGQSKLSQTIEGSGLSGLRQFGTFEVDIIPGVKPYTKYSEMVKSGNDIRYHLEKAIYLAHEGRPGPVFLDIPIDIQGALIDPDQLLGFDIEKEKSMALKNKPSVNLDLIFQALTKAQRPVILAGYGVRVSQAVKQLQEFCETLQIPVLTTCFGKDVLHYDHNLFVGHPGMKGERAGNFAVQTADFVLSIGCSLHVTTTGYELDQFAPHAVKVLVDPDEWVLQREAVGVQHKVQIDCREFLSEALSFAKKSEYRVPLNWVKKCQSWKNQFSAYREPSNISKTEINYYNLMGEIDQQSAEGDIIVTDAGSAFYVVGQAYRVKKNQRIINSGSLGAMGFALPAATGAAIAEPKARVICITGDGSLQTNLHELAVFYKNNLNIKLIVINNDGYVCIRNTQNNFFKGHLAGTSESSGVYIPELKRVSETFRIPFFQVKDYANLNMTLADFLNQPGPAILEVISPRVQEIVPSVSSVRLENGSMKSKPLHDMFPFMSEADLAEALKI
jgi:acetolactate synthase-1/2/3 large subunit